MSASQPRGRHVLREGALDGVAADAILARASGENFPVAQRLLPRRVRGHLMAIYGFARLADHLGDEVSDGGSTAFAGDRLALLDVLEADLDAVFEGTPRHSLLRDLVSTVRACGLPREPFQRLIEANRQDQRVHRYASWEELRGYCALSADPVGHLVLGVFGVATPERLEASDAICTALQLVEHAQDVAEDRRAGRVYLPACALEAEGCPERDLDAASASPALRRVIAAVAERAAQDLRQGEPLVGSLSGSARLAVAGFVAGGFAAVDSLHRVGFDVLSATPRTRRRDVVRHALAVLARSLGSQTL